MWPHITLAEKLVRDQEFCAQQDEQLMKTLMMVRATRERAKGRNRKLGGQPGRKDVCDQRQEGCFYCQVSEHWKKDCPELRRGRGGADRRDESR